MSKPPLRDSIPFLPIVQCTPGGWDIPRLSWAIQTTRFAKYPACTPWPWLSFSVLASDIFPGFLFWRTLSSPGLIGGNTQNKWQVFVHANTDRQRDSLHLHCPSTVWSPNKGIMFAFKVKCLLINTNHSGRISIKTFFFHEGYMCRNHVSYPLGKILSTKKKNQNACTIAGFLLPVWVFLGHCSD